MKYLVVKFWKFALFSIVLYILGMVCGAGLLGIFIIKSLETWERSNRPVSSLLEKKHDRN